MCPTGTSLRPGTRKPHLRSAFDVLDADNDGKISREDLKTFYGGATDDETIGTMISAADSNKDGFVEYEEFENVLGRKKSEENQNRVMEEVFRAMDKDGDGKVGHEDLKSYLGWAGLEVSDDEINAMIKLGGGDDFGGVTYDGFLKILAV
jgi:calmodulin